MAEGRYVMGIDFGTGGVRVGIFDRTGMPKGFTAVELATNHPRPGWAEQDPDEWWSCLVQATRRALQESGVAAEEIAGISVDAMSSTVLAIDEHGRPLRPGILWMDVRASEEARRIQETGDPALKYNGFGAVSPEWGLPKALWIKKHEPEVYASASYIVDLGDWLIQRLTGERVASINIVSSKYYYDRDEGGWPDGLYEAVDGEDLLGKFPDKILDLGVTVGGLRTDVAEELGLHADTPVAEGAVDAYAGALGLGVIEPGKLALITGSSHVMIGQSAKPVHSEGFWGAFTDAMVPGQYTVEAGQTATGSIVAWFKNNFAADVVAEAERRGVDAYELLTQLAGEVPVGSEGLIVLDYFQGNRSPHTDPLARGLISGLSLRHGKGHVFRAIIESICYGTEDIFRTMRAAHFEPELNVVSGGPAQSELWMQLHADISNIPISLTRVSEGPVLGAAMLAAVGAGIYRDLPTAVHNMVHTERTIEPDQARHEEYSFWVERYIRMYASVKDEMHTTVRHVLDAERDESPTEV